MSLEDPIIIGRGLQRCFIGNQVALDYDDFTVPRGRVTGLIGSSGVGKTTLLNLISGVDEVELGDSGSLKISFERYGDHIVEGLDSYPYRGVGQIFQQGYLLPMASVALNVASGGVLAGNSVTDAAINDCLADAGLGPEFAVKRPWQISGGEAQRVGIARALVRDPELLFADEPTSNLDFKSAERMLALLRAWVMDPVHPERTMIWVSHDLDLLAKYADDLLVLGRKPGRSDGPTEVRVAYHANPRTREGIEELVYAQDTPAKPPPAKSPEAAGFSDSSAAFTRNTSVVLTKFKGATQSDENPQQSKRKLSRKLAISQLYNNRSAYRNTDNTAFFAYLHRLTSRWDNDTNAATVFLRLGKAFSAKMTLTIIVLSVVVMSFILGILIDKVDKYQAEIANPKNCTAVITSSTKAGVNGAASVSGDLTGGTVRKLANRPWLGAGQPLDHKTRDGELHPRTSCTEGPAAFGRRDFAKAFVCASEFQGDQRGIAVPLLVTTNNEPILGRTTIVEGNYSGMTLLELSYADPTNTFFYADPQIFISGFLKIELSKSDIIVDDGLCLDYNGNQVNFIVEGVVDTFPSPRTERFEAFITDSSMSQQLRAAGGNYSQLQIYFDPNRIDQVRNYLSTEGFDTVGDTIDQTQALIQKTWSEIQTAFALGVLVSILFAGVVYNICRSQLNVGAQAFAVLQSMGLTAQATAHQICIELRMLVFFATVAVLLLLGIYLLIIALGLTALPPLYSLSIVYYPLIVLGIGISFAIIVTVVTHFVTRRWFKATRRRSEVLG